MYPHKSHPRWVFICCVHLLCACVCVCACVCAVVCAVVCCVVLYAGQKTTRSNISGLSATLFPSALLPPPLLPAASSPYWSLRLFRSLRLSPFAYLLPTTFSHCGFSMFSPLLIMSQVRRFRGA